MTPCDEVLEALGPLGREGLSEALRLHVDGCPDCQGLLETVRLSALAPVSPQELDALASASRAWRPSTAPPSAVVVPLSSARSRWARQLGGLMLAAGLGAVVTSAVLLRHGPAPTTAAGAQVLALEEPALPDLSVGDEANLSDDDVFFDVSWPSATESDSTP